MELVVFLFDFFRDAYKQVLRLLWIPLVAGICAAWGFNHISSDIIQEYYSSASTVLGILIGFSLSYFAIILSANSKEFILAKQYFGQIEKKKSRLSLYHKEVATIIFVILFQVVLLAIDLFVPFVIPDYQSRRWLLATNVFGILFILSLLLRCVLDAYLIVTTTRTKNLNHD